MKQNKKKIWMAVMLAVILLLMIGFLLGARIKEVHIVGCKYYTEEELQEKLMHNAITKNTYGLYFTYALDKGEQLPFIESIEVKVNKIGSVDIHVVEKPIVGCMQYMSEYIYFDKDGVVVESDEELLEGVPLIEGIHFTKMTRNKPLGVKEEDQAIFEQIKNVSQLLIKYEIDTDRVKFDNKRKITLYVGKVRVKLGKRTSYDDQIAELSKLLPKAKKKKLKGELDMEYFEKGQEQIVFKKDE